VPQQKVPVSESESTVVLTLGHAVRLAANVVEGCQEAGVSIVDRRGAVTTEAATSSLVAAADAAQTGDRSGPAATMLEAELVSSPDLAAEARWQDWARATLRTTPFRSLLAVRVSASRQRIVVLSFYADRPHAFTGADLDRGRAMAEFLALTMRHADIVGQLQQAAESRAMIGRAQGILMQQFELDAEPALAVLQRISSHMNRRMVDIATEIVETRTLPAYSTQAVRR
jgi:hypothetical protein